MTVILGQEDAAVLWAVASDLADDYVSKLDRGNLARLVALVQRARRLLDEAEDELARRLAKLSRDREFVVEHLGTVHVRRSRDSVRWDTERLWATVTARAYDERKVDQATGEALESEGAAVARVLAEVFRPPPSGSPRQEPLKKRHIPIDEYRESVPGKLSIQIQEVT